MRYGVTKLAGNQPRVQAQQAQAARRLVGTPARVHGGQAAQWQFAAP